MCDPLQRFNRFLKIENFDMVNPTGGDSRTKTGWSRTREILEIPDQLGPAPRQSLNFISDIAIAGEERGFIGFETGRI